MLRNTLVASPVARGMLDIELRETRHADESEAFVSPASSAVVDVSIADVGEAGREGTPPSHEAAQPIPDDAAPAGAQAGASGDADLASRIARLWDSVPDELRELMAQSGAADAEAAGAGYDDAAAATRAPEAGTPASSSRPPMDMGASMSAAADMDALLAPLRADYPMQADRAARVLVDARDSSTREGPALAEEPGEPTPASVSVSTDAATDSVQVGLLGLSMSVWTLLSVAHGDALDALGWLRPPAQLLTATDALCRPAATSTRMAESACCSKSWPVPTPRCGSVSMVPCIAGASTCCAAA
jgi:hypothetical protein